MIRALLSGDYPRSRLVAAILIAIVLALLLAPFALISCPLLALGGCLLSAAFVIFLFTFYVSVVRKEPFAPAFREMIFISFGVAAVSFMIGWGAQRLLGISM